MDNVQKNFYKVVCMETNTDSKITQIYVGDIVHNLTRIYKVVKHKDMLNKSPELLAYSYMYDFDNDVCRDFLFLGEMCRINTLYNEILIYGKFLECVSSQVVWITSIHLQDRIIYRDIK